MVNPQPYASVAAYASALNGQSKALITNSPVAKVRRRLPVSQSTALFLLEIGLWVLGLQGTQSP